MCILNGVFKGEERIYTFTEYGKIIIYYAKLNGKEEEVIGSDHSPIEIQWWKKKG